MFIPYSDDNPAEKTPYATVGLIVLNVAMLFYVGGMNDDNQRRFVATHGFIPARLHQLNTGQVVPINIYPDAQWLAQQDIAVPQDRAIVFSPDRWGTYGAMITSMFLHGGMLHLLGNMWFLWLFGPNIEDRLGHGWFLFFYLLGGWTATMCHTYFSPAPAMFVPVVGASGAVATVLGAYAVTFPKANVRTLLFLGFFFTVFEIPALIVLGVWFAGQVLNGLGNPGSNSGVAWWAHVGGFVFGAALMPLVGGSPTRLPVGGVADAAAPMPEIENNRTN